MATWVHGKVEVAGGREAVVLQPGRQCGSQPVTHALIVEAKANWCPHWLGKMGSSFQRTLRWAGDRQVARWYGVEMVYDHSLFRESRVHLYEPFSDARRGAGYAFQGMEHPL